MRKHFILALAIATIPLAGCGGGSDKASDKPTVAPTAPAANASRPTSAG